MPTSKPSQVKSQTFTHHIRELRTRLFATVAVGVILGSVTYYYHDFFMRIIMAPLGDQKLVYLTPVGGFSFVFMVTFYATVLLMLPLILYQIYAFLKPAIPKHTARQSFIIWLVATLLMAAGASFGYFFAVPGALEFLGGFAGEYATASLTADAYLRFVLGYVLGIGILFELPLLLMFWHWIHPLTPKGLLNSERYVIVFAFIAAAILSPTPDILSQAIIAVPIIVVYQLGVAAVLVAIKKDKRHKPKPVPMAMEAAFVMPKLASVVPQAKQEPTVVTPAKPLHSSVVHPKPKKQQKQVMDGFIRTKPTQAIPMHEAKMRSERPRSGLVIPKRPQLINDFKPIRRQSP